MTSLPFRFDTASRAAIIEELARKMEEHYVYPDRAAVCIQHLRDQQAAGIYDTLEDFPALCHQLTLDLQMVSKDRHLVVLWRPEDRAESPAEAEAQGDEESSCRQAAADNYGFRKVEILDGNIGLIQLSSFHDPLIAGDTAAAAMRLVSNTYALNFDVRNNLGGDGRMPILLCSYLCSGNQWELSGYYLRKVGRLEPSWTMPYVPGPYYTNRPVYVLTSAHSFSASELLAYDLQALKRATIVGEVTGGAAHGAEFHHLPSGCDVLISYSAPTNPITGGNWEAVGVQPDIAAPEASALRVAHGAALQAVLDTTETEWALKDEKLRASVQAALDTCTTT
jgi:hypothetical protein